MTPEQILNEMLDDITERLMKDVRFKICCFPLCECDKFYKCDIGRLIEIIMLEDRFCC